MDKALVYETRDSRFEPWVGHLFLLCSSRNLLLKPSMLLPLAMLSAGISMKSIRWLLGYAIWQMAFAGAKHQTRYHT